MVTARVRCVPPAVSLPKASTTIVLPIAATTRFKLQNRRSAYGGCRKFSSKLRHFSMIVRQRAAMASSTIAPDRFST